MNIGESYINLTDALTYNIHYAPSYPDEDKSTLDEEQERIKGYIAKLIAAVRSSYKRQQLEFAAREIDLAFVEYAAGSDGRMRLEDALAWIRRSKQNGPPKNDFVIGSDGTVREV